MGETVEYGAVATLFEFAGRVAVNFTIASRVSATGQAEVIRAA